jgi:formylglycine-generating enzyme required for sulfatase activity
MKTDSGVTLTIPTERYWIGRYPVTNAQFARFIDAGGYKELRWWTTAGWAARQRNGWTQPRYWTDRRFNGPEQPVVGVSWYEVVAFCLWLSEVTGEPIHLPTEAQWQYAAQGGDGRAYPWGNDWDCKRCNNSVGACSSDRTTPVRAYEGKGDSPFGVVDMAGNVWEWCLTGDPDRSEDIHSDSANRVLRGGSWLSEDADRFRCDFRYWFNPGNWHFVGGFRVSRSSS